MDEQRHGNIDKHRCYFMLYFVISNMLCLFDRVAKNGDKGKDDQVQPAGEATGEWHWRKC